MDSGKGLAYLYSDGYKAEKSRKRKIENYLGEDETTYLDLSAPIKRDVTVDQQFYESLPPLYDYSGDKDLVFEVKPDEYHYIDLSKTEVFLKVRIVDKDGKPYKTKIVDSNGNEVPLDTKTAPGNNFFSTMFKEQAIKINGLPITKSNGNYPYTGYIYNNVVVGGEYEQNLKNGPVCLKEKAFDTLDKEKNPAFEYLHKLAEDGPFHVVSKPIHGLFKQPRLLPLKTRLNIAYKKSSQEFALYGKDANFGDKFEILDAKLRVCKVKLNQEVEKMIENDLEKGLRHRVYFKNYDVTNYTIPAGKTEHVSEVLFLGKNLPEAVVIGMVSQEAYDGKPSKSPFNFQDFGLVRANVLVNGQEQIVDDLKVDVSKGKYVTAFMQLSSMVPKSQGHSGISPDEFLNGYFLLCWEMGGGVREERLVPPKSGSLRVNLEFKEPTAKPITVIVFSQTNRQLVFEGENTKMI